MKFRVDGLGLFAGGYYNSLEEARNNIQNNKGRKGSITVEIAENEYLEILRRESFASQKIISLQKELELEQTANKNLASEISSLKNQLSRAEENVTVTEQLFKTEQQKTARLENDINTLNKFVPRSKINTGAEKVIYNPYACGLTFHKITPLPKEKLKTVELTDRSQILMNHISYCLAVTSLSVGRLLGCGRKSARSILNKMWLGGYLECVECLTETNTFKLYYLPGSGIEIKTANQVCHLAVLSLLYATFAVNINTFSNLSFKIEKASRNGLKGGIELKHYTAKLGFVYTEKLKSYKFHAIPLRKNEDVSNMRCGEGTRFYILPLKNIKEAEKIVEGNCAYTIDDNLIKNNLIESVYFKK